jgi:hypothetical protein
MGETRTIRVCAGGGHAQVMFLQPLAPTAEALAARVCTAVGVGQTGRNRTPLTNVCWWLCAGTEPGQSTDRARTERAQSRL